MSSLVEFIVFVAPFSFANFNLSSLMSITIISETSAATAPNKAEDPIPPTPKMAKESPFLAWSSLLIIPTPVGIAHPNNAAISGGTSLGIFTTLFSATTVCSKKVVIAGNARKEEKIKLTPFELIKGKQICGTWGGSTKTDEDIPYYAKQYLDGKLKINKLISKSYSLKDINDAFSDLKEGKIIRALIQCNNLED